MDFPLAEGMEVPQCRPVSAFSLLATSNPVPVGVMAGCFALAVVALILGWGHRTFSPAREAVVDPALPEPALPPPLPVAVTAVDSPYTPPGTIAAPVAPEFLPAKPGIRTEWFQAANVLWATVLFGLFAWQSIATASLAADPDRALTSADLVVGIVFQFLLAGITAVTMIFRARIVEWLGLRWPSWKRGLLLGPATVAGVWVLGIVLHLTGFNDWIQSLGGTSQDSVKLLQQSHDKSVLVLMAVAAVIVAPLCEEVVFRGYLYPIAKKYSGRWGASVATALVFAAAHGNLQALLPLFLLGLVLVELYERTGSLWAPILAHFCLNGSTVALQMLARVLKVEIPS